MRRIRIRPRHKREPFARRARIGEGARRLDEIRTILAMKGHRGSGVVFREQSRALSRRRRAEAALVMADSASQLMGWRAHATAQGHPLEWGSRSILDKKACQQRSLMAADSDPRLPRHCLRESGV